ncbi:Dpl1 [Kluyveromyces lactis]|nr:Dpl1 [Kluyveromyces lactis]
MVKMSFIEGLQKRFFLGYSYKYNTFEFDPIILATSIKVAVLDYFRNTPWYWIIRDAVFYHLLFKVLSRIILYIRGYGLLTSISKLFHHASRRLFEVLLSLPMVRGSVDKEVSKVLATIEKDMIKNDANLKDFPELPRTGLSEADVLKELDKLNSILKHSDWENGKVSGAVYHGGDDLIDLQSKAFKKFCVANQLHPDVFPGVRKMEAEVVSMVLNLFNAPPTGCGTTTSGGTESLLLACISAKMLGLRYKGITEPEIIIPKTAHAGFDKAGYYFGIKIHHVDLDPVTFQADVKQMRKLINRNTVMLAGSAPNFPHGIIDDIVSIGKLGETYKIPVHVDCCLGSFIVAFMSKAGFNDVPLFDFRVPGVTSISCDTHKYGFAPKGSSVIMYRNSELRKQQYYVSTEWTGGLYGSPTLAGSRPGALVVGCWATMVHVGADGYINSCKDIVGKARELKEFIQNEIPELQILGDPLCSVISFTSDKIDIYELSDTLSKSGWHLSALQNPSSIHLALTKLSLKSVDELKHLLKSTVDKMKQSPDAKPSSDGTSALYGVAGSVKTVGVADRLIEGFLDSLYKLEPEHAT